METLIEKIIKILSQKSTEQHNPIVRREFESAINDIRNEVFDEIKLFEKYEYAYNISFGIVVTETTPCDLLHEFFNSKSDANKYLNAEQQEDVENEFSEYVKTISYPL